MKATKFFTTISSVILSVYGSADPNLFGSKDRREWKGGLADEFKAMAGNTQKEIDTLQATNPFESAASKNVMKQASRNARWQQNKGLNYLGAGATPEGLVALQGATVGALGNAAGTIAAGAEANRINQVNALRGLQQNQMGTYAGIKSDSINERGSGWKDFFSSLDSVGNIMSGAGEGAGALVAALSDEDIKENIRFIGPLQGKRIYKFSFKGDSKVHIGVIAQEIEETEPEKVIEVDGIKKVDYDKVFDEVEDTENE